MGGEGSMLAMIVSYRNNRQMLKERRKAFNKDRLNKFPSRTNRTLKFRKVSAMKVERIKEQIRQDSLREEQKNLIAVLSVILISSATI